MDMSVVLPAPFSPSRAWICPGKTDRLTRSFARTPGNRLTMLRSSSAYPSLPAGCRPSISKAGSGAQRILDLDLPVDDVLLGLANLVEHVGVLHGQALAAARVRRQAGESDPAFRKAEDKDLVPALQDGLDPANHRDVGLLDNVVHHEPRGLGTLVDVHPIREEALVLRRLEDAAVPSCRRRHDLIGPLA